jgi:hypothetical protein
MYLPRIGCPEICSAALLGAGFGLGRLVASIGETEEEKRFLVGMHGVLLFNTVLMCQIKNISRASWPWRVLNSGCVFGVGYFNAPSSYFTTLVSEVNAFATALYLRERGERLYGDENPV